MNDLEKAQANLEAAINEVIRLQQFTESHEGNSLILTDWVVCAVQQTVVEDSDGDLATGFVYLLPNGKLPWHRILGTIRGVEMVIERDFQGSGG